LLFHRSVHLSKPEIRREGPGRAKAWAGAYRASRPFVFNSINDAVTKATTTRVDEM
jgi:hypothetical protein